MVNEGVVSRCVDAMEKSVVESVERFESRGCGVVDGAGSGLYDWLDVRFVLVHKCLGGVHVECA